jgi:hypothetical protein
MKVREILDIKNSKMGNMEKARLIANMFRARSKRNNPSDGETPSGWNAAPYPGSQTDHTGRG